jgi:hypothetical protein
MSWNPLLGAWTEAGRIRFRQQWPEVEPNESMAKAEGMSLDFYVGQESSYLMIPGRRSLVPWPAIRGRSIQSSRR